jgi:TPR repeat protein
VGTSVISIRAAQYFKTLADAGNAAAQNDFGMCLLAGAGVGRDERLGAEYLRRAAKQGNPYAIRNYCSCLAIGLGIDVDAKLAKKNISDQSPPHETLSFADKLTAIDCIGKATRLLAKVDFRKGRDFELHLPSDIGVEINKEQDFDFFLSTGTGLMLSCPDCSTLHFVYCGMNIVEWQPFLPRMASIVGKKDGVTPKQHLTVPFDETWRQDLASGQSFHNETMTILVGLHHLRLAAEQGNADAQCAYGICLFNGDFCIRDKARAVHYFTLAADQGNALGQYNCGMCLFTGAGVKMDKPLAGHYFKLAADQGHAPAQHRYGMCLSTGNGVAMDCVEALRYLKQAADQGGADAQFDYGVCIFTGKGCPMDREIGSESLRLAADQGHVLAQSIYGAYVAQQAEEIRNKTNGQSGRAQGDDDSDQLFKLACYYLEMSANQGNCAAQYNYGVCLQNGWGVDRDVAEAARYIKLAADQGDADAQCAYGTCLFKGLGVKQDQKLALSYFKASARQGNLTARCNYGIGIFQSGVKATITPNSTTEQQPGNTGDCGSKEEINVGNLKKSFLLFNEPIQHADLVEYYPRLKPSQVDTPFAHQTKDAFPADFLYSQ